MFIEAFLSNRISIGGRNRLASIIAVAGVSCSVIVMLLTIAIALGFKHQIKEKLSGFIPQISILPAYDYDLGMQAPYLEVDSAINTVTTEVATNTEGTLSLRQPGILKTNDDFAAVVFTCHDGTHDYSFEKRNIIEGRMPNYTESSSKTEVVISKNTASRLNLKTGDKVTACFFIDDKIKARRFEISGIYSSNFGDYDNSVAYGNLSAFQQLCGLDSAGGTSVEYNGFNDEDVPVMSEKLQDRFIKYAAARNSGKVYVADNITRSGSTYLNWLELLDTNVYVIFGLMCFVAAFTLISSLFILILNSIVTIGILRAMGADKPVIRHTFILVAMRLVGLGLIFGNIFALLLIWLQLTFKIMPLNPEMYYLSSVPVEFSLPGILLVNVGVIVFSWLILVLPARLASSVSPAKTMRYE